MGKGKLLLYFGIGLLLVMFVVMIYLMATMTPPKLQASQRSEISNDTADDFKRFETMFYSEELLPYMDRPHYGLEKADLEELDFYHSTYKPPSSNFTGVLSFSPRNVVPPLWPRASRILAIKPTVRPVWDMNTRVLLSTETVTNSFVKAKNKTTVKPMKRRSVGNIEKESSGSIILKILDNVGHARIEIKLNADNKNLTKNILKDSSQNNHILKIQSSTIDEYVEVDYPDKSIVITPNESLHIGDSENARFSEEDLSEITNITYLLSKLLVLSKKDIRKNNSTRELDDDELEKKRENTNNAARDRFDDIDKESFDNNTKLYSTHNSTNTSNHVNSGQDNETYSAIDKITNTEFSKMVFDYDDTTNATTGANNFKEVKEKNTVGTYLSVENDGGVFVR